MNTNLNRMEKFLTLLVPAFFLATPASAQVSIGLSEMPAAGDELRLTQANLNLFINYAQTGPGFTWNYANLQAVDEDTTTYQTVSSTNIVYALVYADIFFNPNRANHATAGVDIPFYQLLPIADPYTFLYRSNTEYRKVGFGAELAGIPVPITFSQQDVIYELPLNYGDASVSNSAWNVSLPTLAYYGYQQTRSNEVDGWGTITTPAGSFDALRVKTTLAGRDTINVDTLGIGFAIERPLIREYKWLTPGLRVPVLQVNTTEVFGFEVVSAIYFYDEPRSITVEQPLAASICPGASLDITYSETGVFNTGGLFVDPNDFIVQLSDANGDFTNAVDIGQVTAATAGTIAVTIPANTPPGTGYRIRIVSTSPAYTGADNGFDITIDNTPPVAVVTANGPTTFCAGGSVTLDGTSGGGLLYQWQLDGSDIPGATSPTLVADATGSYTVIVSSACGVDDSDPMPVTVEELPLAPSVLANGPTSFCDGGSVTLVADLMMGVTYTWSVDGVVIPNADTEQLEATAAGSYTVSVTSLQGCSSTSADTIVVAVIPAPVAPAILASDTTVFCDGGSVILVADLIPGVTYTWSVDGTVVPNADTEQLVVATSGSYTVTVTDGLGCGSASADTIAVTVNATPAEPVVTQVVDTLFASGSGVFQWSVDGQPIPGATDAWYVPTASGAYTVTITDGNGCTSTSQPYTYIFTAVAMVRNAELRAWPNPTQGTLWLDGAAGERYSVIDASGRVMVQGLATGRPATIELGGLAPGMYELRLERGAALRIVRQ
ncbi:MAG TPA: hypothetical protein PKE21_08900 [Flavobacteriales bacterium]|nr:hypothetical protein [Flavobacteriales bacterium]HMR27580.1 hypothetical protein [Flavobacteriales bacterium]